MRFRFAMGVVGIVLAAVLGVASPAMAKGGGGGGGGGTPCATITSWNPRLETVDDQSVVVLYVGVFNGCVDAGALPDKMPVVGLTTTDTATGAFVSRSAIMAGYGQNTYRFSIGAPTATPPARTITVDVTKPNGSVQDSRSTTLADLFASVTVPA
jgi:hypothetical protein